MKRILSAGSLLFFAILLAGAAWAGPPQDTEPPAGEMGMPHPPMPPMMMKGGMNTPLQPLIELGLDDGQITRLIDVHSAMIKRQLPLVRRLNELGKQRQALLDAGETDAEQLRDVMQEMGKVKADLMVNRMQAEKQARALLNAEQLEKLGDRPLPMFGGPHGGPHGGPGHPMPMMRGRKSRMPGPGGPMR
ncbi:MAG TPA: hypothetical protein ENI92_07865 [Bacteroidetes bacterium]|nr:hypothetical protein [Bacteroidota bacterium]